MGDSKQRAGRLIKKTRKTNGLTQEDLGKLLNVNRSVVSEYERGNQNLTLDTLDKIAEAMGMEFKFYME